MTRVILQLEDSDYRLLKQLSRRKGKSIEKLISEWIAQFSEQQDQTGDLDVRQDPIYQFEGYDSKAPEDFSVQADKYIYQEK